MGERYTVQKKLLDLIASKNQIYKTTVLKNIFHVEVNNLLIVRVKGFYRMLKMLVSKTIVAQIPQISEAKKFISSHASPLVSSNIWKIELAAEEAIVNIIRHGYKGMEGLIQIDCEVEPSLFKIHIKDNSPEFNPTVYVGKQQESGKISFGGRGISLMRAVTDNMLYKRTKSSNILTLIHHR